MKLRNRIVLSFILAAALILLLSMLLIYLLSAALDARQQITHVGVIFAIFVFCLLLAFIAAQLAANYILSPLKNKLAEAQSIGNGQLHQRVKQAKEEEGEIAQIVSLVNHLLDKLQNSFELQRNFISNASHEIRNPLTAIMGEAEVSLEKRRSPEAYIESLSNIAHEADRLDALINSLLSLAKTELEDAEVPKEEVRLDEILLELKHNIDNTNPHNQLKLDFSNLPADAEQLLMWGNPNLMRVALTNLMENASKFSRNKEVVVKLEAAEKAIRLSIIDQGIGIPSEEKEKIFQPFYRARNARSFKGFGIGLSLTDRIIKLHAGEMVIHSQEGTGTSIDILFRHS